MKQLLKKFIPKTLLDNYHYALAMAGAIFYRHPSKNLFVIGVTGTKGKSTTVELIRTMLEESGLMVASASTINFKIGKESKPNLFKMTMPGRFFLQQFLHEAVTKGVTHVVIEMTSEGARQYRHKGIEMNALVFTNLAPEHLESHGGMEAYAQAKLSIAEHLATSQKRPRYIVANMDDTYGKRFLDIPVETKVPFSLKDAEPYSVDDKSVRFLWRRELFTVPLPGLFNLKNVLACLALGEAMHIPLEVMKRALEHIAPVPGRAERVNRGQQFTVVVDYAHTPDSLRALFEAFKGKRLISVMGSTGGGRDQWKRPEMGAIADQYCDMIILTNEDPYDEDPQKIMADISKGFSRKKPFIIFDRRAAMREAFREAKPGDTVLITGKGTDPYIMGPKGTKEPWSDKKVAEEELEKLFPNTK